MRKTAVFLLLACFMPIVAQAVTYNDILAHKASASKPYWGDYYQYKNIKWISHQPYFEGATDEQLKEMEQEALEAVDERGQIDIGAVDLDGDGKDEYIKAIRTAYGGPAKGLIIEVYNDKALKNKIGSINPQEEGYNPNFKVEDIDKDGASELITFAGIPGKDELRFDSMHLSVRIYKYKEGTLKLSRRYLTKERFEPHYVLIEAGLPK